MIQQTFWYFIGFILSQIDFIYKNLLKVAMPHQQRYNFT